MTDIVKRLRSLNDGNRWPMMDEAADEIERLRTDKVSIVVKAKDDEIERLRTRLAIQFGMHPGGDLAKATGAIMERLRQDNERLRAALQDIAEDPYAIDSGAAETARRALESKP